MANASWPDPQAGGGSPVTASTGATVDTASRAGKTIYKFTGSGSITLAVATTREVRAAGGGAGGGGTGTTFGSGGGGAGGYTYDTVAVLPAGTLTVTVGAWRCWPTKRRWR